jgi:hypothetical protein
MCLISLDLVYATELSIAKFIKREMIQQSVNN